MNPAHFSHREDISKVALPSGATLICQEVPDALSVSLGIWVRSGSRDEGELEHGITHFLEHMVFKGTKRRSALDIALTMDRIGGQLDAFTTKELTCFMARVLAEYFDNALDLLSDLVAEPVLDETLLETERHVVIEEIQGVKDDPEDLIHDLASAEIFGDHPLGRPILGTESSVSSFSSAMLQDYLGRRYTAPNLVIAVAGPMTHAEVQQRVGERFSIRGGERLARGPLAAPEATRRLLHKPRDLNQQHIWLGRTALGSMDDDRYCLLLLGTLLGGSMSSRLFQAIREEAGLAYSVFSFSDFASDTGLLATYMAVSPERCGEAIDRTLAEFLRIIEKGCAQQELNDTKMQLKGHLLLAMESITARMNRLARNEIIEGRFVGIGELVGRVDDVSTEDIQDLAARFLDPTQLTLVSLGPSPDSGPF
jgi:predicted Zn-dependent peptidase